MGSRIVAPTSRTLPLSDGDWIRVIDRLNHGETEDLFRRRLTLTPDGWRVDPAKVELSEVTAYLLAWSFVDDDGAPLPMQGATLDEREASLRIIDQESFAEVLTAIRAHVQARTAERETQKKILTTAPASSPISESPAAVAGGTSGSTS